MIAGLPLAFATPWLLAALIALPLLWWLLRAVPPAPLRQRFPAITLLLGLEDRQAQADRTPWWLLLLRLLAVALMILGFAGPVLNPETREAGRGPLLIVVDNFWPAASDWTTRLNLVEAQLDQAALAGRPVSLTLSHDMMGDGAAPAFQTAGEWQTRLSALTPVAWDAAYGVGADWAAAVGADVVWISDGVAREGRADLLAGFEAAGQLSVFQSPEPRIGLLPVTVADGALELSALRSASGPAQDVQLQGIGPDPDGVERVLSTLPLRFENGATRAEARLSLPPEIRNRITRFQIENIRAAGAVTLADDTQRRRRVALLGGLQSREGLELLSPLHFLREALQPSTEVIEGESIATLLEASPEVLVLPDVPSLTETDQKALAGWVAKGGLLLRFAGPRLAAADTGRGVEDILLPVRLRSGGRIVGGAMSWGAPRALAPFKESSPFFGLRVPGDVSVRAQILAEPSPDLAERTIAELADGTPLVTRKVLGEGQVVLFHISANAEWSTLSLSGLFMQMLERLAVSTRAGAVGEVDLEGTDWLAVQELDGFGQIVPPTIQLRMEGAAMTQGASASLRPGLYADEDRRLAVNTLGAAAELNPATWPARIDLRWQGGARAVELAPYLLGAALVLGLLDILASLWISGRLFGARGAGRGARGAARAGVVLVALMLCAPYDARAQEAPSQNPSRDLSQDLSPQLLAAAAQVTFAYVKSGERDLDAVSQAGLQGLSDQLTYRTSVEPAPPVALDIESDELSAYPLIYWPITARSARPSLQAYERLKHYLATGGFILFDTRDAGIGGGSAASDRLRVIATPLALPALEPVPHDHVLTRAFYLLNDFPGRYNGAAWVEAAPPNAEQAEGMPFRNLNDGVSPVIIGGNDWAGAWAVRPDGAPMFPVGRGLAGERQREMAARFGVNLVMHILTGNYKSDQVHVPALLERLGE